MPPDDEGYPHLLRRSVVTRLWPRPGCRAPRPPPSEREARLDFVPRAALSSPKRLYSWMSGKSTRGGQCCTGSRNARLGTDLALRGASDRTTGRRSVQSPVVDNLLFIARSKEGIYWELVVLYCRWIRRKSGRKSTFFFTFLTFPYLVSSIPSPMLLRSLRR